MADAGDGAGSAMELALMRLPHDEAVADGNAPMPDDVTGWAIGSVRVMGRGTGPGRWRLRREAEPPKFAEAEYEVRAEALMGFHGLGLLRPPEGK